MAPVERRRLDPQRARADERGPGEGLAEPARPAAAAGQELPRDVEAALMSRDNILHKVRTALGRSAGQAVADAAAGAPARAGSRRWKTRIAIMMARVEALAGKTARVPTMRSGARVRGGGDRGQDGGGLERAVSCGVRHRGSARRAHAALREPRRIARTVRHGGYRHHQRRLRAGRYRHAGDALEPAGSAPDLAAAAGAHRRGAARPHPHRPRRAVHACCPIPPSRPVRWC